MIDGPDEVVFLCLESSALIESYEQYNCRVTLRHVLEQAHGSHNVFNRVFAMPTKEPAHNTVSHKSGIISSAIELS